MKHPTISKEGETPCVFFSPVKQNGTGTWHAIAPSPPGDVLILPLPRSAVPSGMQLPSGQKIVCGLTDATFDTLADVHR